MSFSKGKLMSSTKTLRQREMELRSMLTTEGGRKEIQELESRYLAASGKMRPSRASVITYILVHEREQGFIRN